MLNVETEFPQVFSKALLITGCTAVPVKILQNLGGGAGRRQRLQVSVIGQDGASAVKRVTRADLVSAAPLSDDEEADLVALERELAGTANPKKAKLARHEELRHRYLHTRAEQERERRIRDRDRYESYRHGGRSAVPA